MCLSVTMAIPAFIGLLCFKKHLCPVPFVSSRVASVKEVRNKESFSRTEEPTPRAGLSVSSVSCDDTEAHLHTANSFAFTESAQGHEEDKERPRVQPLPYPPRRRKKDSAHQHWS